MTAQVSIHRIKGAEAHAHPGFSVVQIKHDQMGSIALHLEGDNGFGARIIAEAINTAVSRNVAVPL
jgi:hypothetical protein